MKKFLCIAIPFILFSTPLLAETDRISAGGVTLEKVNQTSLSKFFIHVYDITLFAPEKNYAPDTPHALHIVYDVEITKEELAERSVEEMKPLVDVDEATLKHWYSEMLKVFRDVKEGDSIRAFAFPKKEVRFYYNDGPTGIIRDPVFVKAFMGIWLSEETSEPEVRARLLSI